MLLCMAGTGWRDLHLSPRRSNSLHVTHPALRSALRRGGRPGQPLRVGVTPMTPKGGYSMKLTKVLGLAAVGAMLMLAVPTERAQALSLNNPGAAAAVQDGSRQMTTEVRWGHHGHHHHWRHWRR